MNKVFLTGATGFTGHHACKYYINKGYEVYGAVRGDRRPINGVQLEFCDLMNTESLKEALEKVQPRFILHLAAQNHSGQSWNDPIMTINTNVIGTMNLLEAAKNAVPHAQILITGSVIEFNPCHSTEPNHPYGLSKYVQTLLSRSWSSFYNLDIRIAKTSNLIGPGHSNGICTLVAQKCLQYRKGDTEGFQFQNILDRRDFLDVRDAVKAYDCILQKGRENETYIVASGETHTLLEVAKELKKLSGSDLPLTTQQFLHTPPVHYVKDKLENLDWNQTIPLKQSLKDIVEYLKQG
ncbi:NAD-dependent epimerase/dehydratase family protein [Rossellomorea vietnamensis]|uniref:NAD-dependent epimerase/dehydratase family protein n=1 Tax=Rossellomorea vietnamensis TaxID=218284 RepID=UPI003D2E0BD5